MNYEAVAMTYLNSLFQISRGQPQKRQSRPPVIHSKLEPNTPWTEVFTVLLLTPMWLAPYCASQIHCKIKTEEVRHYTNTDHSPLSQLDVTHDVSLYFLLQRPVVITLTSSLVPRGQSRLYKYFPNLL